MKKTIHRQLIAVDWIGIPLGHVDAIQSFLVDHPDSYYMMSNRQGLYYLTREFGLIQIMNDFTMMDEGQVSDYLVGVIEMLYSR